MTYQHHVFLSYSRKDTAMMQRVRDDLRASGLTVWTDEGLEVGTSSWEDDIEVAIRDTGCLVVLLSPNSKQSKWVKREITRADKHKKRIFPLLIAGDDLISIPFRLDDSNFADIRTNYDIGMKKTIGDIRKHLSITSDALDTNLRSNAIISDDKPKPRPPVFKPPYKPPLDYSLLPRIDYSLLSPNDNHLSWVDVSSFYISRYPITNRQYMDFINHRYGYHNEKWWNYSDVAIQWYRNRRKPMLTGFHEDTLPVVNVSWYEAVAFCFWLGEMQEQKIMLPNEEQWNISALLQQEDINIKVAYPWGNEFDSTKCNFNSSGPTPVNKYANPDNPNSYPEDMSGNVWEWCYTEETKGNIPLNQANDNNKYVLKGGSWRNTDNRFLRIDTRISHHPNERSDGWGFRIVRMS